MQMPAPSGGTAIDHVAHRAEDFAFAHRRFGFGAFRDEYLEADMDGGTLSLRRFVRSGAAVEPSHVPAEHALVDGTVLFWALGLLPLEVGSRYRFPTWNPTAEGAEIRESAVLEVRGRRPHALGGDEVDAHLVVATTGGGQVEMLVSPRPPYLLKQTMVAPDGSRTTVVEAISVSRPSSPDDEVAIRNAGARFSRAYVEGDTATVRSLYTADAQLFPPDRTVEGGGAIARYFAPAAGRTVLEHRMDAETLDLHDDLAIEVGTWLQVSIREQAEPVRATGRYLIEWTRELDGAWRIRRDMWHRGGGGA